MRSRVGFLVLPWEFFLAEKVSRGDHGWVVSIFRLKAPPGISSSCISPLTSSGQLCRASWASQPQKSATLSPHPGGKPRKFIRTCGGNGGKTFWNHYHVWSGFRNSEIHDSYFTWNVVLNKRKEEKQIEKERKKKRKDLSVTLRHFR